MIFIKICSSNQTRRPRMASILLLSLLFLTISANNHPHPESQATLHLIEFAIESSLGPIHEFHDELRKRDKKLSKTVTVAESYLGLFKKLADGKLEKVHFEGLEKDTNLLTGILEMICPSSGNSKRIYDDFRRDFAKIEAEQWYQHMDAMAKGILANMEGKAGELGQRRHWRMAESVKCMEMYASHYEFLDRMLAKAIIPKEHLMEAKFISGWLRPILEKLYLTLSSSIQILHAVDYAIQASLMPIDRWERKGMHMVEYETAYEEYLSLKEMAKKEKLPEERFGHLKGTGDSLIEYFQGECKVAESAESVVHEFVDIFSEGMEGEEAKWPTKLIMDHMGKEINEQSGGGGQMDEEPKKCIAIYASLYEMLAKMVLEVNEVEEKAQNGKQHEHDDYVDQQVHFLCSWLLQIGEKLMKGEGEEGDGK